MTRNKIEHLLYRASGVGQLTSAMMSLQAAIRDFELAGLTSEVEKLDEIGAILGEVANNIVDSTSAHAEDLITDKEPATLKTNA